MADSREYRQKFFVGNFVLLGILVLILGVVFLISDILSSGKVDLTTDKIYTISKETKEILGKLKDNVYVTYYCSEELPSFLQTLRRDTKDMFDEFRDLSNKHFEYSIVNPEAKAADYAEQKVKKYYATK